MKKKYEIIQWFKNNKTLYCITICVAVVLISVIFVIALIEPHIVDWFPVPSKEDGTIVFHAVAMVMLTIIIIMVAWIQLSSLSDTSKSDFLLRIDERYRDQVSVEARAVMHRFWMETRGEDDCLEVHKAKISDKIKELGKSQPTGKYEQDTLIAKEFTILLNFLDFLETATCFANNGRISKNDLRALLGNSLKYYYDIFKPWIYYRRSKYKDDSYYCELTTFFNEETSK